MKQAGACLNLSELIVPATRRTCRRRVYSRIAVIIGGQITMLAQPACNQAEGNMHLEFRRLFTVAGLLTLTSTAWASDPTPGKSLYQLGIQAALPNTMTAEALNSVRSARQNIILMVAPTAIVLFLALVSIYQAWVKSRRDRKVKTALTRWLQTENIPPGRHS